MKNSRLFVIYFLTNFALLFMLFVFLKETYSQRDINQSIQKLKIIEYFEGQQIEQIDANVLSAYLSALERRHQSHNVTIAIIGAFFTFLAFFIQYRFNETQKQDISRERFENNYAHLLDIFRGIWRDWEVPNVGRGKVVCHYMFYEYKAIFNLVKRNSCLRYLDVYKQNKISFSIFLNGVSLEFGSKISACTLNEEEIKAVNCICEQLLKFQLESEGDNESTGVTYMTDYKGRKIKYFDGHRMRLIPYFKYLITIFDYLNDNKAILPNYDLFFKQLISEMSEHEIGLLYSFFSFSGETNYSKYLNTLINSMPSESYDRFIFSSPSFIIQPTNNS